MERNVIPVSKQLWKHRVQHVLHSITPRLQQTTVAFISGIHCQKWWVQDLGAPSSDSSVPKVIPGFFLEKLDRG
jgi:hypothetical protein